MKFADMVAPLSHFIPDKLRKKIAKKVYYNINSIRKAAPKQFVPDKFPYGINLFGLFKAEIGLAQGAKLYAQALEVCSIPHTLINLNFMNKEIPQLDSTFDAKLTSIPEYAVNVIHINGNNIEHVFSEFPSKVFDHHYNIGVWLWELEKIPDAWIPVLPFFDEIWVPSHFIAHAIQKSTEKHVTVIPYGISVPYDPSLERKNFELPDDKFLILTMYDSNSYASRKNPAGAISAFTRAFSQDDEKVHLVIKINNPTNDDLAFIRKSLGDDSRYTLISERMNKDRLNSLIRLCDVFISLHRSEGFGLVMAEAMALGTPAVATNWSANAEFMPEDSACMVGYTMIPVKDHYVYKSDDSLMWADPDIEQAAVYLKRLYNDKDYYQKIAENGRQHIERYFSLQASGEKIRNRLDQILSDC